MQSSPSITQANVQPSGKGGMTSSLVSGQPSMGQPNTNADPNSIKPYDNGQNNYQNTVGQWDNASIQQPQQGGGKSGKGGSSFQPLDVYTPPVGGYSYDPNPQPLFQQQDQNQNNNLINLQQDNLAK